MSGLACAACSDATNCAVCTSASAGACTKCQNSKVLGGGACLTGVTNCKADTATTTYNKHNGTAVTCDECAATHIKKADGTSCIDCAAITNCKTKVAVDASCGCSECNVDLTNEYYYYLTGTGA